MKRKKRNIPVELLSPEAMALESKLRRRRIEIAPVVAPSITAFIAPKMPVSQSINKIKLEINFILEKFLSDQLTINGQTKRHFILFCENNKLPVDESALLKFMVRNHFSDLSDINIESIFYNPGKSEEFSQQILPLRSIFSNINSGTINVGMVCDASFKMQIIIRDDLSLNRKRLALERFSAEYNLRDCLQREQPISYKEVMAAWLKQLVAQYSFLNHKSQVRESLHLSGYSIEEILGKIECFLNEESLALLSIEDICFLKENLEEIIFEQDNIQLLTDMGTKSYFHMEEEHRAKIKKIIEKIEIILSPVQEKEDLKESLWGGVVVENENRPILAFIPFEDRRNAGGSAGKKTKEGIQGNVAASPIRFFFDKELIIKPYLDKDSAYQYIFMLTLSVLDPNQFTLTREIEMLVAVSKKCLGNINKNEDIEEQYRRLVQFINRNKDGYFRQRTRDSLFIENPKRMNNRRLCDCLQERINTLRALKSCLSAIVAWTPFFGVESKNGVVEKLNNAMCPNMEQNIQAMKDEGNDDILGLLIKYKAEPSSTVEGIRKRPLSFERPH